MVVSELQQAGDPAQADLLETLSDVQQACSTAVDILNGERGEE
jgi:signal transduction histidine kinase